MPTARIATVEDLEPLLELYRESDVGASVGPLEQAQQIWREILDHDGLTVFVSEARSKIVATCTLIMAPNLLQGGQRHALLENVVTHPLFKGEGHGRAVVEAALSAAWAMNCYRILLHSGTNDPRTPRFYAHCGFEPPVYATYVAPHPRLGKALKALGSK